MIARPTTGGCHRRLPHIAILYHYPPLCECECTPKLRQSGSAPYRREWDCLLATAFSHLVELADSQQKDDADYATSGDGKTEDQVIRRVEHSDDEGQTGHYGQQPQILMSPPQEARRLLAPDGGPPGYPTTSIKFIQKAWPL